MDISIVLAAGEGTRMKSRIPKVLHKVCGKPLLEYVIEASKEADINKKDNFAYMTMAKYLPSINAFYTYSKYHETDNNIKLSKTNW